MPRKANASKEKNRGSKQRIGKQIPDRDLLAELRKSRDELELRVQERTAKLKDSENRYRLLTESHNDLVAKFDADYKLSYVNPNYCKMFGKQRRELIGKTFIPFIHEDDRENVLKFLSRLFRTPYRTYDQVRVIAKNGIRWVAWSNRAILDDKKRVKEVIAVGRDFTERKIEREVLKESENRYRTLVENTFEGIAVSVNNRFVFLNSRILELLGYSYEEVINKNLKNFVYPDDLNYAFYRIEQRLKGELEDPYTEFRIVHKDGRSKWFRAFCTKISWGNQAAVLYLFSDINELKLQAEQLRKNQVALKIAQSLAKLGNWERNPATGKVNWSDENYRIYGYEPGKVEPTLALVKSHIHPADLAKYERAREADYYGRKELSEEYRIVRKDGEIRTVHVISTIKRDIDGKPLWYFGTVQDITERKQIELQLRDSERQLEKRVLERTEELQQKSQNLEDLNTSLRIILDSREKDKKDLEEKVQLNLKQLVLPYLEKLDETALTAAQKSFLDIIKENLKEIVSPFTHTLSATYRNLTPREIKIADLLRRGKNSKEIGALLNISSKTVDTHRKNIRKKLRIENLNVNLKSYLLSLSN